MVRKLVVLLSSILFSSSQISANTDYKIEFKPSTFNIYEGYSKNYGILPGIFDTNKNHCGKSPSLFTRSYIQTISKVDNFYFSIDISIDAIVTKGHALLAAYNSNTLSNYSVYKELNSKNKDSYTYQCDTDYLVIKKNSGITHYADFNGDGLGDVLYIANIDKLKNKSFIFYGINVKNVSFYHKNDGPFFSAVALVKGTAPSFIINTPENQSSLIPYVRDISHLVSDWTNANITIQDRNKDGRDDLLITRPGAPDLIAFAAEDGSFPKAEVDTGIGKYNGPSLYKSQFCNRALLTQHPDENPSTVLFDDICRTAYVSPPATGTTEVTALTPDPDNAAFCPKLASVQTNQTELLKELGQANTKFKTIMGSLPHDTQLMTYATTREQAFNDLLAAEQAEAAVQKTVLSQRRTIGQLELDVEDCALLGTDCNTAQNQLTTAQQALTQLLTELDAAVEARLVKQQVYDQAYDAYGEALDNYLTVDTELAALIEAFKALQDKELALYREFAGLEGATAQIHYQWDWAEQVNRYRQVNQQLKMQWQPLPVTGAKILAELQEKPETPLGDKAITLPAVLYTSIDDPAANVKINGYETALMPKGDAVITSTLRKEPSNPISLPSKIHGTVGLSLAGYCPFAPSANQPQPVENLAAHLTPHIQYEYEEQIKRGYTAKYKLDTFVKTIVRTKKKKKWFKKKKKTYIERKVITKDWFNIQFDASSGEYAYSPSEQDQITREVKSDLVHRVNTAIGALYADNSQCQANKDCSYGYWLGQLTGNNDDTKAIQQFKQGNSKWVEEVVYGIRYRPKTGWVGFR
ncbi:hypothetical protein [Spartinivicinus ruber]|uniref:hypothetical protein n=1 Tax=Spartinivicinus ruber TaxID=2683272 RepID=UPI0013D01732|nr:hypothetical protein [Spartinivicinus ruber]